ncbi:MAG: hypothetical protein K2M84_02295, partial [Anaeroplasmataceae bacterium]|nr:hypothetical protein [Anaeroplasmataceae bacterium]
YLAKLSLDLLAKKKFPYYHYLSLNEFYKTLWYHQNLRDIWQIGSGLVKRLHKLGAYTLHDVAMMEIDILKKEFGVIGEDLYEHAWGKDTTTIADIKAYEPLSKSFSRNQILFRDYTKTEAWTPLIEMLFLLCMDLISKNMMVRHISFYIGYSKHIDSYHKSFTLDFYTDDYFEIKKEMQVEYKKIKSGPIRRIGISLYGIIEKGKGYNTLFYEQNEKYDRLTKSIQNIWKKHGKNYLVIGTAVRKESTLYQRNHQIGGHNSE